MRDLVLRDAGERVLSPSLEISITCIELIRLDMNTDGSHSRFNSGDVRKVLVSECPLYPRGTRCLD